MDYNVMTLLKDRRDDERVVSIQHDHIQWTLEDALGDGFVFLQGNRDYANYMGGFDADDYPEIEHWFVLDVYEHGGIQYSLSGGGIQCQWDIVQGGAILGLPSWEGQGDPELVARSLLKSINAWANGETYWFIVEDGHGNEIDSCAGLIGIDAVKEAVTEALGDHEATQLRDLAADIL